MTPASQLLVVRSDPLCAESSLELQDDGLTPSSAFYVRNNFPVPPPSTRLSVGGAVNQPDSLAPEDLQRLPRRRLTATLERAGNGRAFMNPPVPGEQWRLGRSAPPNGKVSRWRPFWARPRLALTPRRSSLPAPTDSFALCRSTMRVRPVERQRLCRRRLPNN